MLRFKVNQYKGKIVVVKCGENRKKTCNTCNELKEINYMNDDHCAKCRSAINKAKREAKRITLGKSAKGSGRSPYCSTCKKEKEPGRQNESRCKKCKSEAYKARNAAKRDALGLKPWGTGRNNTCSDCGEIKENVNVGYCNSCHRKKDREWRLRTGRSLKNRTGKCQCGNEMASYSNCYCVSCASEWRRNYLQSNPKVREKLNRSARERYYNSGEEQFKVYVRGLTNRAIQMGYLVRGLCEVCNSSENIDAHHDDYMNPLDVRWLCKLHHAEHHKNEKK